MEERGYYDAAMRMEDVDDYLAGDLLITDEATAEAVESLQEDIRQLQLSLQMDRRKMEILMKRLSKLELRFEELESQEDDGK